MEQFELPDERWASDLVKGVQQYTDALYDAVYDGEEDTVETITGYTFCGCEDCFWRETLTYLVPKIIAGYREGKVLLDEDRGPETVPEA